MAVFKDWLQEQMSGERPLPTMVPQTALDKPVSIRLLWPLEELRMSD